MLNSTFHNKSATYEDPMTSAIFENLILLQDDVLWHILRTACFESDYLPKNAGSLLYHEFWPHWDPTETGNSNFVEPDLFLAFEEFNVIIEAKYGDGDGQNECQWKREIQAYFNECASFGSNCIGEGEKIFVDNKKVFLIAIGGNGVKEKGIITAFDKPVLINIQRQESIDITVQRCSWFSLLVQVSNFKKELEKITVPNANLAAIVRLLNNIVLAFNLNGIYCLEMEWFDALPDMYRISEDSIRRINNLYKWIENE